MTKFSGITPVLRIFDEAKAREFYIEFLGFQQVFEHRLGDNFPIYIGIAHSGFTLHLTEHHGDASPGAALRISTDDVDAYSRFLAAKDYKYAKPGEATLTPWGTKEITLTDPFGNRLVFFEPVT